MNKNVGLSCCRVVAAIFIVVCHITKYYTMLPFSDDLGDFFDVGVQMFFILSGYLYGKKNISDWKSFYRQRYLKVCLPLQIWAVVLFICSGCKNGTIYLLYIFNISGLGSINKNLVPSVAIGGLGHTWFVTIIILCYMLIPLMQRVCGKYEKQKVLFGLVLLWIIALITPLFETTIYYFPLFLTAYFIAYYDIYPNQKTYVLGGYWLLSTLAISLAVGRIWLHLIERIAFFYDNIYVPISHSLLGAWIVVTICVICKWQKNFAERISRTWLFRWLERLSYSIYITHFCLIAVTYRKYDIGVASAVFFPCMVCTSVILYMLHKWVEKWICRCFKI